MATIVAVFAIAAPWDDLWHAIVLAIGLVYVPLVGYAILSSQIFDIDLRLKIGISRGTMAGIGVVVVFVALKAAESYLSREIGFLAGAVAAGIVLFMAPRLNRVADKVADAAMPKVQPTPAYLAWRKLEVYRAAVESALEEGSLTEKERAILDRLRTKLNLTPEDARAVEDEARGAPPGAPATAAT